MKKDFRNAYLERDEDLAPFYRHAPDAEGIAAALQDRAFPQSMRDILTDALERQYTEAGVQPSSLTTENIHSLRNADTFTLTTGHQLALWGGPLYVLYKILTVIRMAEEMKAAHPGKHFVPVFWMASEDHDFVEINTAHAPGRPAFEYPGKFSGAVGRHITEVMNVPDDFPSWDIARESWKPGVKWSHAFRRCIDAIFRDKGLVVLDGDDVSLKRAFIPEMETELTHAVIWNATRNSDAALEAKGFSLQLRLKDCNLFYLTDESRLRIDRQGEGFRLQDDSRHWTLAEILLELHAHPERFSPNAGMRPVYQEKLLPNLVYSGGWGEFAYWFQLLPAFEAFGIPFPVLIPRFSATLLGSEQQEWLATSGITLDELRADPAAAAEKVLSRYWDAEAFASLTLQVSDSVTPLQNWVGQLDPTLARSVAAETARLHSFCETLEKKLKRSIRNRHPKLFQAAESLSAFCLPGGEPQERVFTLSSIPGYTPDRLSSQLHLHISPFVYTPLWIPLP